MTAGPATSALAAAGLAVARLAPAGSASDGSAAGGLAAAGSATDGLRAAGLGRAGLAAGGLASAGLVAAGPVPAGFAAVGPPAVATVTVPRIVEVGPGAVDGLAAVLRELGAVRPLLVTDAGVRAAGIADRVAGLLAAAGTPVTVWDAVDRQATDSCVESCRDAVLATSADSVVAVGGGTSIDVAKAAASLASHGGTITGYAGLDRFTRAGRPVVAVPTVPGSGAEVSRHATLTSTMDGRRFAVSGRLAGPVAVLADPDLTVTAPVDVARNACLDSLVHAVEAYLAQAATPLTDLLASAAVPLITRHIEATADRPTADRRQLLLGCLYAGIAMANANAGAVHALGYPLTNRYRIPHGLANALVAPAVLDAVLAGSELRQRQLVRLWSNSTTATSAVTACTERMTRSLSTTFAALLGRLGIAPGLARYGVPEADLPALAADVTGYGPVLGNAPVRLDHDTILAAYRAAWPVPVGTPRGRTQLAGESR